MRLPEGSPPSEDTTRVRTPSPLDGLHSSLRVLPPSSRDVTTRVRTTGPNWTAGSLLDLVTTRVWTIGSLLDDDDDSSRDVTTRVRTPGLDTTRVWTTGSLLDDDSSRDDVTTRVRTTGLDTTRVWTTGSLLDSSRVVTIRVWMTGLLDDEYPRDMILVVWGSWVTTCVVRTPGSLLDSSRVVTMRVRVTGSLPDSTTRVWMTGSPDDDEITRVVRMTGSLEDDEMTRVVRMTGSLDDEMTRVVRTVSAGSTVRAEDTTRLLEDDDCMTLLEGRRISDCGKGEREVGGNRPIGPHLSPLSTWWRNSRGKVSRDAHNVEQ